MTAATEPLSDAHGYGIASARPTAGIVGRYYYATDTGVVSRDNGATWDTIPLGGSSLLGHAELSHASVDTTITGIGSGATLTDLDATNLAVAFTVPTSGAVVVTMGAAHAQAGGAGTTYFGIREASSTVRKGIANQYSANIITATLSFKVTGLTPGASKTYKFGGANNGGTLTVYHGPTFGAAFIRVESA